MNKIIFTIKLFLVFGSFFSQATIFSGDKIVLSNPIMGLIDGKTFGINANIFGLILQSRRETRKRLYGVAASGTDKADAKRIGMYEFDGKKYSLVEMAKIEKDIEAELKNKAENKVIDDTDSAYIELCARKEALGNVLHYAKEDMAKVIGLYVESAHGMKDPLLVIIEEFHKKSGLGGFFLLDWGRTKDGDELESVKRNVKSFDDLKVLCLEMSGFLEAMARSCPKGKALFVEKVRHAKQSKVKK